MSNLLPIYLSVLLSALAYGATFPHLSLQIERMGVSPELLGLNAAMPALGWLLVFPLVPKLQARFGIKTLVIGLLCLAAAGFAGISGSHDYTSATLYRLLFGGAIGIHYRIVEYLCNALSGDHERGRNFGIYSFVFLVGIAIGSALQPSIGSQGNQIQYFVLALIAGACIPILGLQVPSDGTAGVASRIKWTHLPLAPAAFLAALIYGLFESIPAYLLPAYAVKNGLGDDIAAYTVTAATLGALIGPISIGILGDRYNRVTPLLVCALASVFASALVPFTPTSAPAFLGAVALLGLTAASIYGLAISLIGDRFRGQDLVEANAAFGLVYAMGSLIGPIMNGAALGTLNSHGLWAAAAMLFAVLTLGIVVQYFGRGEWRPA